MDARLTIQDMLIGDIPYVMVELQDKKGKCFAVRLQGRRLSPHLPWLLLGTLARVYGEATNEIAS